MLREVKHESWETIAGKVVNLQGEHPCWGTVRNIVSEFNVSRGHRQYNYEKSGRKPWKLPPDVQSYIIRRMLSLRSTEVVTSVSLQADLARHKGINVDDATIRKLLKKRGYRWLPRCQKRKYSTQHKAVRVRFAKQVLRLTKAKLKEKLCLSLDGVVLSKPPEKHFPDGIRNFDRKRHDGIVLDDVRDFYFLVYHQEKLQGKVGRSVTFFETPSGG